MDGWMNEWVDEVFVSVAIGSYHHRRGRASTQQLTCMQDNIDKHEKNDLWARASALKLIYLLLSSSVKHS